VGDRRAQQGAVLAGGAAGVGGAGLFQGLFLGEGDEAVQLRIELPNAGQQVAAQLFGGKLLGGQRAGDPGQGQLVHGKPFPLFDDFSHDVEVDLHVRDDGQLFIAVILLGDPVGAQALGGFQWVGQRPDVVGVDGVHYVDQAQDVV